MLRLIQGGVYSGVECAEIPPELEDLTEEIEAWMVGVRFGTEDLIKEPFFRTKEVDWQAAPDHDVQYTYRVRDFFEEVSPACKPHIDEVYTTFSCLPWESEKAYHWRPIPSFWDALPERLWAHLLDRYRAGDAYQEVKNQLIDVFQQAGERRWPPKEVVPEPEPVSRFEREALL